MNTVKFLSLHDAVRSSEESFYAVVERATSKWIGSTAAKEVQESFFDYRGALPNEERKTA